MIRLIGTGYYGKVNYLFGECDYCGAPAIGVIQDRPFIQCECEKQVMRKLPLYYLKSEGFPIMIIYKLTHKPSGKNFIGVIVTGKKKTEKEISKAIDNEVNYLRDFRTFKISPELKKKLKSDDEFTIKLLSTPRSMTKALIEERLYIHKYDALKPNGFNVAPYLTAIKNKALRQHDKTK